jgi:Phage T7 capsid assembly protein.
MTDTEHMVTLPGDVTGPLSPEQQQELAGQQQAEQQQGQPLPEQEQAQQEQAKPTPPSPDDLEAQRGEVQKVLAAEGMNLDSLEGEYTENGGLSDASYEALAKIGFSRKVVDTYIAGVEAGNMQSAMLQDREVQSIKAMVGGDDAYASLTGWAKENLSREELEGFNAITATNNPTAIRMAVKGLAAQYHAAVGKDPSYIKGAAPAQLPLEVYNSWAEVTKDMADPRYREDPAFNRKVQEKLSRSSL